MFFLMFTWDGKNQNTGLRRYDVGGLAKYNLLNFVIKK
jgi:hypothetical protein